LGLFNKKAMKILLKNTESGLIPLYDDDYDKKKMLKIGEYYKATITKSRNISFHRKYFALINTAWEYLTENQQKGLSNSKDVFREAVQVSAGHYKMAYNIEKNMWFQVADSISFDSMDELAFRELYERVKDVIFIVFLSHVSHEEFERNLIEF
jgi:hypothetical protein